MNSFAQLLAPLTSEVKELTKCMRTILTATQQLRECREDKETLVDLEYSLASSYARTSPGIRREWLASMCQEHLSMKSLVEVSSIASSFFDISLL